LTWSAREKRIFVVNRRREGLEGRKEGVIVTNFFGERKKGGRITGRDDRGRKG
jgi:hypothetical protein